MFDKISFFSRKGSYSSEEIIEDEGYETLIRRYRPLEQRDAQYYIDGKSLYLLGSPMAEEWQQNLIYLQSFSYLECGAQYFTKRKNYESIMILYTYKGTGCVQYLGRKRKLHEGDGILIDCHEPHEYCTEGKFWHQCSLHFYGGISKFLYRELFGDNICFHCGNPAIFQEKLERLLYVHQNPNLKKSFCFKII